MPFILFTSFFSSKVNYEFVYWNMIEFVHWFQENLRFQIKNNYDDLCKQEMCECYCIHDLFIVINFSNFLLVLIVGRSSLNHPWNIRQQTFIVSNISTEFTDYILKRINPSYGTTGCLTPLPFRDMSHHSVRFYSTQNKKLFLVKLV
jgi:hypothetical protein